jgi:hypothetical protein
MTSLPADVAANMDANRPQLVLNPLMWWNWWLTPIAPATLGFVYLCADRNWWFLLQKPDLEWLALILTAFATGAFFNHALTRRDPLHLILGCLAFAFLCREIHFTGTSTGVYVALVILVVWSFVWRDRLIAPLERGQTKSWLAAAATMYFLSQMIARRAFAERHFPIFPQEELLHVEMEEMCETVAHICLIVASFAGGFHPIRRGQRTFKPVAAASAH